MTSYNFTYRQEKFEDILRINNSELESRLFSAMDIINESTLSLQKPDSFMRYTASDLLEFVLMKHPNNPAANHYWIHLWEDTLYPEVALPSANILPVYAAHSPHMTHMPGHIYHRVGDYEKSAMLFQQSDAVDTMYLESQVRKNYLMVLDYMRF